MSNYEIYIAIAIMTVVNYFTRVFPFLFFRKNDLPSYILFIEKYFPSVIMTILIFYTLKEINFSLVPYGMKELGSIVFTALLHLIFKNYLVSIFIGTLFYMGLVQYL
ncbi:branched-chain amino acid transport protein, AzlD family [Arcobacter acticola]|jgi:branched-subunit amino acid transport protein AzlD|uniref:Branched-chain amino acid transport protein, AzlD family n=1 Tax=Arcobacter acticola TaxID=1849015 RepID=A0A6M8ECK2_9BACT|nr:AzlD domain-containing protein [Arcobacter acticola]QKE27662.1 branched-chain amino acid transport protein, AzlD family [Arcobacter acticola]